MADRATKEVALYLCVSPMILLSLSFFHEESSQVDLSFTLFLVVDKIRGLEDKGLFPV